ncbi:hypothetical protein Hdeb2414_s0006g00214601 [Helianthus debilis subsp. tardiflorus]
MKMIFRGKEVVPTETIQTPVDENWYQDFKDVPNITLPEKALVGAGMRVHWRMEREEKLVYMEDGKIVSLYFVAFEREGVKISTIAKKGQIIVKNFVLPRDADLFAQLAAGAGMRRSSDSWCDYVVVSDSLEGLAPEVIIRRPKPEPKDTADIPPYNPDDSIDLESIPEHLVRTKAVKRKQIGAEAECHPAKKIQRRKITRKGNLDAFISESAPSKCQPCFLLQMRIEYFIDFVFFLEIPTSPVPTEPLSMVNEELPPSPLRAVVADQLKTTEVPEGGVEKVIEADKPVDVAAEAEKVASPGVVDGADNLQTPDLSAHDAVTVEEHGLFSVAGESSPIRPEETLGDYYYRTYLENIAYEIHAPVWNLKKGDTFSDWRVCHDWFQGIFPPGEIKFQESRPHEQTYQEAASHASTTHRIVREWHSMHKDWAAFKISQKKVVDDESRIAQLKAKPEADQAKFEADRKTEE